MADELRELGCKNVQAENGRVLFEGNEETLARANIGSRYAERILILAGEFTAVSFEELFEGVKALPWEEYLLKEDAFPVSGSSLQSALHSVPDCQAIIKKAIATRLEAKYHLSWFPETGPLHRIRFRILKDKVSVMIDTSGQGLHKRGYRQNSTLAPLKETLAASLVKLARVRSDGTFFDPFCGSGTLLIEAAMLAMDLKPGLARSFEAQEWLESDAEVWKREKERLRALARPEVAFQATGYDIDPAAVALTLENARKAGVIAHVQSRVRRAEDFAETSPYGCVVCNPPYGERLLDLRESEEIYRALGKAFVPKKGWSYHIITPDEEFEKLFGRRADKRRKLYNGMIKCQYYQFFK